MGGDGEWSDWAGSQWAGFDLEKDLLAVFGEEWGVYASPKVGGNGILGMWVVNRPKDAEKLEASLGMLEKRRNEAMGQLLHGQATVAFKTRQVDGVTLHYLAVPIVTPTWAVANGTLYVGLFPQVVVGAADYGKQGGRRCFRMRSIRRCDTG